MHKYHSRKRPCTVRKRQNARQFTIQFRYRDIQGHGLSILICFCLCLGFFHTGKR